MTELEKRLAQLRRRVRIGAETARPFGAERKKALLATLAPVFARSETVGTAETKPETSSEGIERTEGEMPKARRRRKTSHQHDQDQGQSHGH